MSNDIAIRVENLGKMFRIGAKRERYKTFRDTIAGLLRRPLSHRKTKSESFWALKDISFEINRGEVVGVIGRNGAGKSTLLKVLSRITEPTEGYADIFGRVGSLLEVGTGFHPELTGRENVFLNGAILGMRRSEIESKFDEIVAFAEIEKFIDTPVKHYSSGMYLRLAFAVAAHLEPEILVGDEVLAVGDAAFQKKCLGKMGEVAQQGRTVLFVSHNMAAIERLCSRTLVLNNGELVFQGLTENAVRHYEMGASGKAHDTKEGHVIFELEGPIALKQFTILSLEILDLERRPKPVVSTWDSFIIRVSYSAPYAVKSGSVVIYLSTTHGQILALLATQPDSAFEVSLEEGRGTIECEIRKLPLAAGSYMIGAALAIPRKEWLCKFEQLGAITIQPRDVWGSALPPANPRTLLALDHKWYKADETFVPVLPEMRKSTGGSSC